jgi:hypothetical protein
MTLDKILMSRTCCCMYTDDRNSIIHQICYGQQVLSLRQAYDYWQDQPGNFCTREVRGVTHSGVQIAERMRSLLGCTRSQQLHCHQCSLQSNRLSYYTANLASHGEHENGRQVGRVVDNTKHKPSGWNRLTHLHSLTIHPTTPLYTEEDEMKIEAEMSR